MRPTNLSFRSPKERTPDAYFPQVTADGRLLSFSPRRDRGCTIGHEQRFKEYSIHSKKTGYRVGPGSYDPSTESPTPCPLVYRPLSKDNTSNGYTMIGNHLVYDGYLISTQRRKVMGLLDPAVRVDMEHALSQTQTEPGSMRTVGSESNSRPRTEGTTVQIGGLDERNDTGKSWAKVAVRRSYTRPKTVKKTRMMVLSARDKRIRKVLEDRLSVPV